MLSSPLSSYVIEKYFCGERFKSTKLRFVSSTETNSAQTNSHIQDSISGYFSEMEKLGQSVSTVPSYNGLETDPYTQRMRLLNSADALINTTKALLTKVTYLAFDPIKIGATGQDDLITNESYDSLDRAEILTYSQYLNGLVKSSAINYFQPQIKIYGEYLYPENMKNGFDTKNIGDLSFGFPLPYQEEKLHYIDGNITKSDDINVYGFAGEYSPTHNKIRRYALMCILDFYYL